VAFLWRTLTHAPKKEAFPHTPWIAKKLQKNKIIQGAHVLCHLVPLKINKHKF
jgi:hypothetical protein